MTEELPIEEPSTSPNQTQLITQTKPSLRKDPELRLTVVETIYYQQPGIDPVQIDAGFSYFVQENEQLFQRSTFTGEEWSEINTGWIAKAHTVLIKNVHELRFTRNPSDEVSLAPKESMRFRISDVKALRIRSTKGQTRFLCVLIPE